MELEVRAFGPLEIVRNGVRTRINSRLQRVLLGLLLARLGQVVPAARLEAQLWPGQPPANVAKSLQIHVHRLRKLLGSADYIQHWPPGYVLELPRSGTDIYHFEALVQHGRAELNSGKVAEAADLLRQAAGICRRGPAFQGLDEVDDLATASRHVVELWLTAIEDRMTAELALGEHLTLLPELDAVVSAYPLHERFRAQLMTALYRAGRKADALTVYREGRKLLVEELGIEPGDECRALERAILTDDPALRA